MPTTNPRLFPKGQWVQKKDYAFIIGSPNANTAIGLSRKDESRYGVIISSTENNKTAPKVRILFFPYGIIGEVTRSRLDFAEPPADISLATTNFLNQYKALSL